MLPTKSVLTHALVKVKCSVVVLSGLKNGLSCLDKSVKCTVVVLCSQEQTCVKVPIFLHWKSQSNLPRLPRGVVNNRLSQASILKVNSNWGAISNIDWRTKRYLSAWDSNVSITCAVWFWNSLDLCILVNTWCIVNIFDWTHNTDRHITNWSKIFW